MQQIFFYILALAIFILPFVIWASLKPILWKRRQRLKQRRLETLLAGRELEAVLENARHAYGHFQGDDGYRIWEKGPNNEFVHFAPTTVDAELWIIEKHFEKAGGGESFRTG